LDFYIIIKTNIFIIAIGPVTKFKIPILEKIRTVYLVLTSIFKNSSKLSKKYRFVHFWQKNSVFKKNPNI